MDRRSVEVLGSQLSYVEGGPSAGSIVLLVHGNPTSSFLWRHVLPGLSTTYRCRAVDLIGMGHSDHPDLDYGFADHARYLEGFVDALGLRDVTVIGHDWGAVLGLDLLGRRPDVVGRIAVCEGHLHSFAGWDDMDPGSRELFRSLRVPGVGEQVVQQNNVFIEQVLPAGMARRLTPPEWAACRAPFPTPERRLPILRWAQQIPVAGEPADVAEVVARNQQILLHGRVPRLLLYGQPGAVVTSAEVAWVRRESDGVQLVDLGPGTHFLPEDQPEAIVAAVRSWLSERT